MKSKSIEPMDIISKRAANASCLEAATDCFRRPVKLPFGVLRTCGSVKTPAIHHPMQSFNKMKISL